MRPLPDDFPEQNYPGEEHQREERTTFKRVAIAPRDRCMKCGREKGDVQIDEHHVFPDRYKTIDHDGNLAPLCVWCHQGSEYSIESVSDRHLDCLGEPWSFFLLFRNWVATPVLPAQDLTIATALTTAVGSKIFKLGEEMGSDVSTEDTGWTIVNSMINGTNIDPYLFYAEYQPFNDRDEYDFDHFGWWPHI